MGIYKDVVFIEKEIVSFNKKFVMNLYDVVEFYEKLYDTIKIANIKYEFNYEKNILLNLIELVFKRLKTDINEIICQTDELKKYSALVQKDLNLEYVEKIKLILVLTLDFLDDAKEFLNLHHDKISTNVERLGIYIDNSYRIKYSIKINNFIADEINIKPFFNKQINQINNDVLILKQSKKANNISDILGFSHKHKIELPMTLNNNKVLLRFVNNIDFSKEQYDGIVIKQYIVNKCTEYIKKIPEFEKTFLKLKSMNSRQLEKKVLEIIQNTVIEILNETPQLVKNNVRQITFELTTATKNGTYLNLKSDFIDKYIQLPINFKLLECLIYDKNKLSKENISTIFENNLYETIIHELTHSDDYILNNYNISNVNLINFAKKITGKEKDFSQRVVNLTNVLIKCREEGIATISENLRIISVAGSYATITLQLTAVNEYDFLQLITKYDLQLSDVNQNYTSGILHRAGMIMATTIFLDSMRDKFLYARYYSDNDKMSYSSVLSKRNVVEILHGYKYTLAMDKDKVSSVLDNFIKKLSLMPPNVFLEKYEYACRNFNIIPLLSKEDFVKEVYEQKRLGP
jgi:hypothetical protein